MIKRLAAVVWWLGAIAGGIGLIGFCVIIGRSREDAIPSLGVGAIFMVAAWCVAFVLGGSFWTPPRR